MGENILLPVPEFDKRSPFDYRNLGCVILERTEDGLNKIGNSSGRLVHLYTCNQFSISMSQFLTPADVPDKIVTLRQASLDSSLGKHKLNCYCTSGCLSNSCKCRRSNRICNSNCHILTSTSHSATAGLQWEWESWLSYGNFHMRILWVFPQKTCGNGMGM